MLPVLLLVTASITLTPLRSPRMPEYPHVRATDARIAQLIQDATRCSPTFADLYARLQETDIILFVEPSRALKASLSGRLVFLSATPLARYVRADVRADLPRADLIAIIAHEMQHALEIATDTAVRDETGLANLYIEIGEHNSTHMFETVQAQVVARRVRRELLA